MTTTEKLNQIRTRCVELLAIAEKRTPGEWRSDGTFVSRPEQHDFGTQEQGDATFIASAAGPFEAALKSTVAAIDWITSFSLVDLSPCNGGSCMVATEVDERLDSIRWHFTTTILAAWEGIL